MKVMELEYSKSSGGTKAAALPVSPICFDFQVGAPDYLQSYPIL